LAVGVPKVDVSIVEELEESTLGTVDLGMNHILDQEKLAHPIIVEVYGKAGNIYVRDATLSIFSDPNSTSGICKISPVRCRIRIYDDASLIIVRCI
jgi:hypothetical protein